MLGKISKSTASKIGKRLAQEGSIFSYKAIDKAAKGLSFAGGLAKGATRTVTDTLLTDTGRYVKQTANVLSSFVREDKANSLIGYRLKKRGVALAAGVGVLSTTAKEAKTYLKEDLRGTRDGYITPLSPSYTGVGNGYGSYGQQAGATGDLVFALNKNRRG